MPLITLATPAALVLQLVVAQPSSTVEPRLKDVLEHLAASYALSDSYQVKCEVFEAASVKDGRPVEGAAPLLHKAAKVGSDGRVLIDDTHPAQAKAIGLQVGTIYRNGLVVSVKKGKEATRQDVGEPLAMAMPARYAPSHLGRMVSYWATNDPKASIADGASGLLEITCPTHHMSFKVRPSDWTVVAWSEGIDDVKVQNDFEEFQAGSPFQARFPRRLRTTSTRAAAEEPPLITVTLFGDPQKTELTATETDWWTYSPTATDLGHKSFFGPGDVPLAPPSESAGAASRPRPGVDAMLMTKDPGGPRLPVEDRRFRNWLLAGGLSFIVLGVAWTIRKRSA